MTGVKELIDSKFDELISRYEFASYEDTGKILYYDRQEGIYKNAEPIINAVACDTDTLMTVSGYNTLKLNIRGRSFRQRHTYNNAVCFSNGILLLEGENIKFQPHTSKLVFESKVDIIVDRNAKCPVWEQVVKNMLPEEKDRLLLQEWFGYHFLPGQKYEKAMFLTGKPSTGKSTTIYVLNKILGKCCCHHELSDFQEDKQYCIANLYAKLGNTYTDMGNRVISDVGKFKVLTGSNDTVTARFPYERPFDFINPAKLTFASNKYPPLASNVQADLAFWKRVLILQYSVVVKDRDPDLFTKLDSELSGILNWALEGYVRLYKNKGQFTKNVDDVYEAWTSSAYALNPLQEFIDEKCLVGVDYYVECNNLYSAYRVWCQNQLEDIINGNEFKSSLVQKGIFESRKLNTSNGERERVYKGICLL